MFKGGSKTPNGFMDKPQTGGVPEGGYGSGGTPSRAQKMSSSKTRANKPSGGYGTHGKPMSKKPRVGQRMGSYGNDGMAVPKTPIPRDKRKLFNLPKVKVT